MVVSQFHLEESATLGPGYFSSPRKHNPVLKFRGLNNTKVRKKTHTTPISIHKQIVFHSPKQGISQSN